MDALSYEYLIRKAFNCGRGGANGMAEADIYRKMERVENAINMRMSTSSNGDLEYNYRSAAINISVNVSEALRKVSQEFHFESKNQNLKQRLQKLAGHVSMSTDREIIDTTIKEAHEIFKRIKLEL